MQTDNGGSHIPVLVDLMPKVTGPVLELGAGVHSTPLLSWLCKAKGVEFVSYENDRRFIDELERMTVKGITSYTDYASAPIDQHWGLVLIDHAPAERRKVDMLRLKDKTEYMVVHDSEPAEEWRYGYESAYPHFKYRKTYDQFSPHTTVLSNFHPL